MQCLRMQHVRGDCLQGLHQAVLVQEPPKLQYCPSGKWHHYCSAVWRVSMLQVVTAGALMDVAHQVTMLAAVQQCGTLLVQSF